MEAEEKKSGGTGKALIYGIAAVLLCIVTVLSIDWPFGNRTIGDSHESHIYSGSTFRLLSVSVDGDDQLFLFNYDQRYDDTFIFRYDDDTDSYLITRRNLEGYLTETEDHELCLSSSADGLRSRWNITRIGNTMYFLIINASDGYAVCETDDCHCVMSIPDENNPLMQMRLQ